VTIHSAVMVLIATSCVSWCVTSTVFDITLLVTLSIPSFSDQCHTMIDIDIVCDTVCQYYGTVFDTEVWEV
jgi:hypothetical protein